MNWLDAETMAYAREVATGRTYNEAASVLSDIFNEYVSPEQLRSALRRHKGREITEARRARTVPSPVRSFTETPFRIETNNLLVLSDCHAPYHNAELLEAAFYISREHFPHIQSCVFLGDLYNLESLSHYPKDGPTSHVNVDIRMGGNLIRRAMQQFEDVYVLPGNHDRRLMKAMHSEYDFDFVVQGSVGAERPDTSALHASNFSYMWAGNWMLYHPTTFSQNGGKTPADQAILEGCNVLGSHNHHVGIMTSRDGKWLGVDPGHLTDESYHWYHERDRTKYARWTGGFCILDNGYPVLFNNLMTDWTKWL